MRRESQVSSMKIHSSYYRAFHLIAAALLLNGCQNLESREYAVRFWKLPPIIGGGVSERIFRPGEVVLDIPVVTKIYRFDAGVRDLSWAEGKQQGPVKTRALDGNEVALSVTVSYKIQPSAQKLTTLVQQVGTTVDDVDRIVRSVARADIRTYMNELETSDFIKDRPRYEAIDDVRKNMAERLEPYGIEVLRVNLDGFRFDQEYEILLKKIQQKREETGREIERMKTVQALKERELNDAQAEVNQIREEAKGYATQAKIRGDNYLASKKNQAEAIRVKAESEYKALQEQIQALSGPGGESLLKLELAKQLLKSNPRFVVVGKDGEGGALSVQRLDANQLIDQAGVFEALREESAPRKSIVVEEAPTEDTASRGVEFPRQILDDSLSKGE